MGMEEGATGMAGTEAEGVGPAGLEVHTTGAAVVEGSVMVAAGTEAAGTESGRGGGVVRVGCTAAVAAP